MYAYGLVTTPATQFRAYGASTHQDAAGILGDSDVIDLYINPTGMQLSTSDITGSGRVAL
jgi:hypothetical protein